MQVFIKPVDSSVRKSRLLFLMGATWHTKCMFDIDCTEDSFADLLQQKNIESYTFDNFGLGASTVPGIIGNAHQANVNQAKELIDTYNIDSVIAYSYGVAVLMDLMEILPSCVKNLILLDPYPALVQDTAELIDNGDKKLITKNYVRELLIRHNSTATPDMIEAYLSNLSVHDTSEAPVYPSVVLKQKFSQFHNTATVDMFKNAGVKIVFTGSARELTQNQFSKDMYTNIDACSHWILIEPARHVLADTIEQILFNFTSVV